MRRRELSNKLKNAISVRRSFPATVVVAVCSLGLLLPNGAAAATFAQVRGQLLDLHLSPPPLFPSRLPGSFRSADVTLDPPDQYFDFSAYWSKTNSSDENYFAVFLRRGNGALLTSVLRDKGNISVRRVRIGDRTVYSLQTEHSGAPSLLAWREHGRTYLIGEKYVAEPAALKTLSPLVRSLRPLFPPVPRTSYVALGDSYSAGEGVDPYFRDGVDRKSHRQTGKVDNRCHRSTRAYAERVRPPGFSSPLYVLTSSGKPGEGARVNKYGSDSNVRSRGAVRWAFLACSGARTFHVKPASAGGKPLGADPVPQIDSPSLSASTTLVTLTLGGNDVKFSDTLSYCALHACNTAAFRKELDERLVALKPNLEETYAAIRAKAPNAKVLVLGYPQLFPGSNAEQQCRSLRPFRGEQEMLREKESDLNALIKTVSEVAGFRFVDTAQAFEGHEVCGSKGEWINGISGTVKIFQNKRPRLDDEAFHPKLRGQQAMADAVNAALR